MRGKIEGTGEQIRMKQESLSYRYPTEIIGIPIEIISNEYNEFHGNEHQKIVF